jgi:purine-nucleoside phosphorylase
MGVDRLIITNAVGGLNPKLKVGDFVILKDMLTLLVPSPIRGPQFLDLSSAFDPALQKIAQKEARKLKLRAFSGVYGYAHGPHFETPADKKALRILGADVVGMSHVPETVMANYLGMKVLGLTFVTNLAFVKHSHQEVLAEAGKAAPNMAQLLKALIAKI